MSILSLPDLTKLVNSVTADGNIDYVPYDIRDTKVFYGIPPVPMRGVHRIRAAYLAPRTRLINCLTGTGVHASNRSTAGILELEMMSGSASGGAIQVISYMEQPVPLFVEDAKSGSTSVVMFPSCRLQETPEWRRDATPGVDVWIFTSPNTKIIHGMRLTADS